jgi:hypothetical protein
MEDGQDHILKKLGTVFRGTANGEMPHLRSLRLKGGALTYVCTDQQSGQWLIRATRLGPGVRLKTRQEPPQACQSGSQDKDKAAKSPDEFHTEHWRVLNRQPELKGQGLILLIEPDSLKAIEETEYKIFTGLTHGTIKVLIGPEAKSKQEEDAAMSPASS